MKIDVCSDLHVDGWLKMVDLRPPPDPECWSGEPYHSLYYHLNWKKIKNTDSTVLIIAGDIANRINQSLEVIEAAIEAYDHVIFVEGNHDHYDNQGNSIDDTMEGLRELCNGLTNVHYLAPDESVTLDGITFIGGTGWYDWKCYEHLGIYESRAKTSWELWSNDYRYINHGSLQPNIRAMEQAINMAGLVRKAQDDEVTEKIVMVTHMSPKGELMEWRDRDNMWNNLTPSYVNSALQQVLDADDGKKISHWVYGHTHRRDVREIDGVTYVNNARGYPRENEPFSLLQIEVGSK